MFTKLQLKMTVYFSMILVTILFVTNFVVYFVMIQYNQYQLTTEVSLMLSEIESQTWEAATDKANIKVKDLEEPPLLASFSAYIVFSEEDEIVNFQIDQREIWENFKNQSIEVPISVLPQILEIKGTTEFYYLVAKRPIFVNTQQIGSYFVAKNITVVYETLDSLRLVFLISLAFGALMSILLGYFIAGRNLKPVKQAYEMKQSFLANASHELRTPLSVIMLSTNTLEGEIPAHESFQREIVADMKEVTNKMNGLIENLLLLSRSDMHKLITTFERIPFTELLKKELSGFDTLFEHHHQTLETEIQEDIHLVGDEKLLQSLISILMDNAIKYTQERGIIRVTLHREKAYNKFLIVLKVTDSGIGIPEHEIKHIFERFYRVEDSRSKKTGGYGLGLSIAKEIVDLHHGQINVTSNVDKGTQFTVTFKEKGYE